MLNHESNLKLGDSGSSISLKATKKGKYLMSSISRVKIEVRITSRIRSLKAVMSEAMSSVVAAMSASVMAAMPAAELTMKLVAVRGTAEGQFPEKGKAWTLSPGPLSVPSRPGNSVRTTATGLGKAAESSMVELVEGWLYLLTGCGRNSGETRLAEELDKYFGRLNHGSNNIRGTNELYF